MRQQAGHARFESGVRKSEQSTTAHVYLVLMIVRLGKAKVQSFLRAKHFEYKSSEIYPIDLVHFLNSRSTPLCLSLANCACLEYASPSKQQAAPLRKA